MNRFHVIEDSAVIVRAKGGTFRQCKVFRRGRDVYAGIGGGFVRLLARGGTTNPNVTFLDLEAEGVTYGIRTPPVFEAGEADAPANAA